MDRRLLLNVGEPRRAHPTPLLRHPNAPPRTVTSPHARLASAHPCVEVTSPPPLCGGVCLPASVALTGTRRKPTPSCFLTEGGTRLINRAPVPMKELLRLAPPQLLTSLWHPGGLGVWGGGLAYHPWSGPTHVPPRQRRTLPVMPRCITPEPCFMN